MTTALRFKTETFDVRDPEGRKHIVQKVRGFYDGTLHLADGRPTNERPYTVARLLIAIDASPECGTWDGYAWLRL